MSEVIYKPARDIVTTAVDAIKVDLRKSIDTSEGILSIDLSGVDMIDSRGLGLLIATANSLASKQRKLRIVNASSDIVELMRMMRLDRHMEIV